MEINIDIYRSPDGLCTKILLASASAQRDCRKTIFSDRTQVHWLAIDRLFALKASKQDGAGLGQCPKSVDLANVVNQSEPRTRPLYIHFQLGA